MGLCISFVRFYQPHWRKLSFIWHRTFSCFSSSHAWINEYLSPSCSRLFKAKEQQSTARYILEWCVHKRASRRAIWQPLNGRRSHPPTDTKRIEIFLKKIPLFALSTQLSILDYGHSKGGKTRKCIFAIISFTAQKHTGSFSSNWRSLFYGIALYR